MSFSFETGIDPILDEVKRKLSAKAGGVMQAFHAIDKDNSNQLSTEEFRTVLKDFDIVLPKSKLLALIARFDANGDGTVSIPEFAAFMSGNAGAFESLAVAEAVPGDSGLSAPSGSMARFPPAATRKQPMGASTGRPFTATDVAFLARMEGDVEERRRNAFIKELVKHPGFKPSMLEPPKPKFKEVSVGAGPIIKSHASYKTGLETRRPYQWGPLGGYY